VSLVALFLAVIFIVVVMLAAVAVQALAVYISWNCFFFGVLGFGHPISFLAAVGVSIVVNVLLALFKSSK
jgi:hypothetical protein